MKSPKITIGSNTDKVIYQINNRKYTKFIIYGGGTVGKRIKGYFDKVDYFCDKRADELKEIDGIPVLSMEQLSGIEADMLILYAAKYNQDIYQKFLEELRCIPIHATVYNYFECEDFLPYRMKRYTYQVTAVERPLRVCIVDQNDGWILQKFAEKLTEKLQELDVEAEIAAQPDPTADINHYVSYIFHGMPDYGKPITFMITHIDCMAKYEYINAMVRDNRYGICMSREVMDKLYHAGISRKNLCYINPAQDGIITPKRIRVGVTHRLYDLFDIRKRGSVILDISNKLDCNLFTFCIMGSGWDSIVDTLKNEGFEVEYWPDFNYKSYISLMPSLDYWIYYGNDEGNMGYLDALAAGVKCLITPQGFHLDIVSGEASIYCKCAKDFIRELKKEEQRRKEISSTIETYTWENFTKKHIEVWEYILKRKSLTELFTNQHLYEDGIFSVMLDDIRI